MWVVIYRHVGRSHSDWIVKVFEDHYEAKTYRLMLESEYNYNADKPEIEIMELSKSNIAT